MSLSNAIKDENYIKLARMSYILRSSRQKLQQRHLDQIFYILNSGYDINYAVPRCNQDQYFEPSSVGNTLLHFVVDTLGKSHCVQNAIGDSIVSQLLSLGADFTRRNHKGLTPLHLADIDDSDKSSFIVKKLLQAHVKHYANNPKNKNGLSHLHLACKYGDIDLITFFLNSGVSVNESVNMNSKSFPGYSPLHFAMIFGDIDIILLLIKYGADCNYLNADGMSPIHLIIKEQIEHGLSNYELQRKCENILDAVLIQNGYFSRFRDSIGLSNFHIYCTKRFTLCSEGVRKFLNTGVDVNAPVNFDSPVWPGYTPLHFSVQFNLSRTMYLLEEGANLLAKDAKGTTPFDLCLQVYKPDEISRILETQKTLKSITFENGASLVDVLAALEDRQKFERYVKNSDINTAIPLDSPLWPGYTVLHAAVMFSNVPVIELFVKHGADVMKQDANGMTALHLAFLKRQNTDLVSNDEFYHTFCNPTDLNNFSHFHIACVKGKLEKVKEFLSRKVDPNMPVQIDLDYLMKPYRRIRAGSTPLDIAVTIESKELARLLLENGADPTLINSDGLSWVHRTFFSAYFYNFRDLLWLSPISFKVNPVAPGGLSHFHIACASGDLSAVEALLPLVANINAPINSEVSKFIDSPDSSICAGDTALHLAVKFNYCSEKLVHLLLINGADVRIKNSDGLNPIHIVLFERKHYPLHPEIIRRLDMEVKNRKHFLDKIKVKSRCVACSAKDISMIRKLLNERREMVLRCFDESSKEIKTSDWISRHTYNYVKDYVKKKLLVKCLSGQELFIDKKGLSSFHISCIENDVEAVEKYIRSGVDVDSQKYCSAESEAGFTALHFAVVHGHVSVIELLLKHGANVNLQDLMGNTALHLAASESSYLIGVFARTGFDFKIRNYLGKSVLDIIFDNCISQKDAALYVLKNNLFLEETNLVDKMYLVKELFHRFSADVFKLLIECIPD